MDWLLVALRYGGLRRGSSGNFLYYITEKIIGLSVLHASMNEIGCTKKNLRKQSLMIPASLSTNTIISLSAFYLVLSFLICAQYHFVLLV